MDWIKKNYDQFALAAFAVVLLGCSAMVAMNALGVAEQFTELKSAPAPITRVKPLDMTQLTAAQKALTGEVCWNQAKPNGQLFVSWKYLPDPTTKTPIRIGNDRKSMLHPPVFDYWLLENGLDLLSNTILQDDSDGDGFTVLEEYLNAGKTAADGSPASTNPKDPKSHPAYYTKLYFKQYSKKPFRLRFEAYDGDVTKPEKMSFQINTLDLRQPTEFLKLGDTVKNTKFKLLKFEFKERMNPNTQVMEDASELTLLDTRTDTKVVLVINKVTDSPDSFAIFTYVWGEKPEDFKIGKLMEFGLKPNPAEKYKLIDIKDTEALIALPSGEKYTVPLLKK